MRTTQQLRAARDVLGQIADALERRGDLQRRDGLAQVLRDGLAQQQGADRELLELGLHAVERAVARHDLGGEGGVAALDRFEGMAEKFLGQPAHLGDLGLQPLQVGVERGDDVRHCSLLPPGRPGGARLAARLPGGSSCVSRSAR